MESPVGPRTYFNGVQDQVYVLPCNVEPSEADVVDQSAALTAPAREGNERDDGVKFRVRNRLYECVWEAEDLEGIRVCPDNRMFWVVLGEQVLAG